jgi:NADH dehydrogenase
MKILVTGAAGFLGAETVRRALARGHEVRALIRPSSQRQRLPQGVQDVVVADLAEAADAALAAAASGIQGVINCAAVTSTGATDEALSWRVNVEAARRLFEAARAAGAGRWVQISSMSAHPASTSAYGRSKLAFDEFLRGSTPPPEWTILRPSLIYGPGGKGLVDKTAGLMRKLPVVPVVGAGRELMRPVYVSDVADAALDCLERDGVTGKSYMLGGADEVSLNEFMGALARALGLRRPLVHLPIPVSLLIAHALSLLVRNPPLTVDNVLGVRQVQRVEQEAAERDFGYRPLGLEEGLRRTFAGQMM